MIHAKIRAATWGLGLALLTAACAVDPPADETGDVAGETAGDEAADAAHDDAAETRGADLLGKYTPVRLTIDLDALSAAEREMIPILIEAARELDAAFWPQAYGDRDALLAGLDDPDLRQFAEINYGPWDRLAGNEPFVDGVGPKPLGASFYPEDMSKEAFDDRAEWASDEDFAARASLYTVVDRNPDGKLVTVPYSAAYSEHYGAAASKLREAAELAEDAGLKRYLELRADALESDAYRESDLAWMEMKDNGIDVVIGPIETYEDKLFGYKAANEAFVLVKDRAWSDRLASYATLLPSLQEGLPVAPAYKSETPGTDSDLNAYDVVYYAGDCNAGSKTIAINLPNDETVQLEKGTRRLQLKNAMRAKFDEILVPIAGVLIVPEQRASISFDAFFGNTMFHEVAHGLGIKNTITGNGTVRAALKEHASALEEGKADVLGLYMVTALEGRGELGTGATLDEHYVTFMASIFRSIRFGSASAHGIANLIRFNFFAEQGAFARDEEGRYRVDEAKLRSAMDALSEKILRLQGDGDYAAVGEFVARYGVETQGLRADLDRLSEAGIPVDIVFEQGWDILSGDR